MLHSKWSMWLGVKEKTCRNIKKWIKQNLNHGKISFAQQTFQEHLVYVMCQTLVLVEHKRLPFPAPDFSQIASSFTVPSCLLRKRPPKPCSTRGLIVQALFRVTNPSTPGSPINTLVPLCSHVRSCAVINCGFLDFSDWLYILWGQEWFFIYLCMLSNLAQFWVYGRCLKWSVK